MKHCECLVSVLRVTRTAKLKPKGRGPRPAWAGGWNRAQAQSGMPAHARAELDAGARPVSADGGRAGGGQEGLRRTLGRRAKTSAEGRAPCRLETQAARLPPHQAVLEGLPRSGRERAGGAAETAQAREAAAQARASGARAGSGPAGRLPRPLPQVRVARGRLPRPPQGRLWSAAAASQEPPLGAGPAVHAAQLGPGLPSARSVLPGRERR